MVVYISLKGGFMTEKEYIELKKEELNYIENVFNLSASKKLSETEIIEIARKLNDYAVKLSKMYAEYCKDEYKEIEFEFDVNSNYLSNCNYRKNVLAQLGIDIETNKFTAEFHYAGINLSYILNGQNLRCVYIYIMALCMTKKVLLNVIVISARFHLINIILIMKNIQYTIKKEKKNLKKVKLLFKVSHMYILTKFL